MINIDKWAVYNGTRVQEFEDTQQNIVFYKDARGGKKRCIVLYIRADAICEKCYIQVHVGERFARYGEEWELRTNAHSPTQETQTITLPLGKYVPVYLRLLKVSRSLDGLPFVIHVRTQNQVITMPDIIVRSKLKKRKRNRPTNNQMRVEIKRLKKQIACLKRENQQQKDSPIKLPIRVLTVELPIACLKKENQQQKYSPIKLPIRVLTVELPIIPAEINELITSDLISHGVFCDDQAQTDNKISQ
jgi:hypothetical protein